ncbi:MAG: 50S ribosomal L9 C-terminal domain-containing protein, partial [Bacteroidales bacterium]|nr:50S ribosomal L9 C-terminal domain-containing protein [Bacteroidales bacterium]
LAAKGFEIDRRNISITEKDTVKEIGIYDATVKCHRDIKANIKVEVVGED